MSNVVLGLFADRSYANDAVNDLQTRGYNTKDISIIMRDTDGKTVSETSTGENVAGGALSGATTGGMIGAIAGLLVGIGAIAIPGIGGVLIGGPIAAALGLTGAAATTVSGAVTGALAGGLLGGLVGLGVPEEEAKIYESRVKEGQILVFVPLGTKSEEEVRTVLAEFGATEIRSFSLTT
jgi:uncharacterized membrane protein